MDGSAGAGGRSPRAGEPGDFRSRLAEAVAEFGAMVRWPLAARRGRPEDQIAAPAAQLVRAAGRALGLRVVTHAETPLSELSIRPDFAVEVEDGPTGFIEVKQPGKGANPAAWTPGSHDGRQWQKLRLLPNVLYTDGSEWALYRNGERAGPVAKLTPALESAGHSLAPADGNLALILEEFLWHPPDPPRNLRSLVRAAARLCSYLREEVIEVLAHERTARGERPFTALAAEWRDLLFPRLTEDDQFADAYAQTITFALLLARNAGIAFEGRDLPAIGRQLGKQYAVIGRALSILSDPAAVDSLLVIETMRRVIGAVDWDQVGATAPGANATLYETFLQEYDPSLRRKSGSYYTPDRLARSMVRFTDEVLREKLDRPWGYANDDVIVVDPAMGSGTFLVEIVDLVASRVKAHQGEGAWAQQLRDLFRHRLIGFERQVAPYAVSEMRLHHALKTQYDTDVPEHEMRFLADTFEDPDKQEFTFGKMYAELSRQRQGASRVKRDIPVMAVIGNPPYLDRAHKRDPAPWIEARREKDKPVSTLHRPSMDEFRQRGRRDFKLSSTWVFYWRWAIWKAFEAHPAHPAGIVAFITPSSYLTGAAYGPMRAYLRAVADEAWIIDVSPERHQPPVRTRIFPEVQQPLCVAVFARYGQGNPGEPARVHYRAVTGTREEKLQALERVCLGDAAWQDCPDAGDAPFRPSAHPGWHGYPLLGDLLPWQSPGVKANRTWVIAPDPEVLLHRWELLVGSDQDQRDVLLKTTERLTPDSVVPPVPGHPQPPGTLREETTRTPLIVPYAYRAFDRQYLILDTRVIDRPRANLWVSAGPQQVYVSEPYTNVIDTGPALTFTATVPDTDCYQGHHAGRVLPLYRDAAGTVPNAAPGLLEQLSGLLGRGIEAPDLLAYIAAVAAHHGYTRTFRAELAVPGIRIPLSSDSRIWDRAVPLGRQVISLHTAATHYPDPAPYQLAAGQPSPAGSPHISRTIPYPDGKMPDSVSYDRASQSLRIGVGEVGPVPEAVWDYSVGGMRVVDKWVGYRLRKPRGRPPASPLDTYKATAWTRAFNDDLLSLLHNLEQLVQLEAAQETLLDDILNSPLVDLGQLRIAGVLPVPESARRPLRPPIPGGTLAT